MGESAFGKGFGQIDKVFDPSMAKTKRDREWSKIPNNIFDGLANRYRFVFIKRTLRRLGWNIEFDWPKDMIKVSSWSLFISHSNFADEIHEKAISSLVDDRKREAEPSEKIDVLQHMLGKPTKIYDISAAPTYLANAREDQGERPDTGTKMSNRDVIDQMAELLLAGSETTSGKCFIKGSKDKRRIITFSQ